MSGNSSLGFTTGCLLAKFSLFYLLSRKKCRGDAINRLHNGQLLRQRRSEHWWLFAKIKVNMRLCWRSRKGLIVLVNISEQQKKRKNSTRFASVSQEEILAMKDALPKKPPQNKDKLLVSHWVSPTSYSNAKNQNIMPYSGKVSSTKLTM